MYGAIESSSRQTSLTASDVTPELMARREAVLTQTKWFPGPEVPALSSTASGLVSGPAAFISVLQTSGAAHFDLDRSLTDAELISLAKELGSPLPETHPSTVDHVDNYVILNIRPVYRQPNEGDHVFSEAPIALHTESVHRPLHLQPRYLVFECIIAPPRDKGGQTILVSMESVARALAQDHHGILAATCLSAQVDDIPIELAGEVSRPIIRFSDTLPRAIAWRRSQYTTASVKEALHALLDALYSPPHVRGIAWQPHRLVVIDNQRWFHGRTATISGEGRHIRRVRVLPR